MKLHDPLKPFKQHGFIPEKTTGSGQTCGNCVLCGRPSHFFVNNQLLWDCKRCGKSGNIYGFISQAAQVFAAAFKGPAAISLEKDRSISVETFRRNGIGYNVANSTYTIPV